MNIAIRTHAFGFCMVAAAALHSASILPAGSPQSNAASPKVSSPGPRTSECMLYDARRADVLLIGGRNDIWSWNGREWAPLGGSLHTQPVLNGGAVYDARQKSIVAFWSGRQANKGESGWLWDGRAWTQIGRVYDGAPLHYATAYDPEQDRILRFGGAVLDQHPPLSTVTSEWNGNSWTPLATEGPAGRVLQCGSLVYDSWRHQIVLFGGIGDPLAPGQPQQHFGDTWGWDWSRRSWRRLSATGPNGRGPLVFDEHAGVVLAYGGGPVSEPFEDMWQWDGRHWIQISLTGPTPGKRALHMMAYDPKRRRTVLYGGQNGKERLEDTWEWDGTRWERKH